MGEDYTGHEETLGGGDVCIHYLDCGDVYLC